MEVLKNQTLYKCSFCGKRLLSKNGAAIHEQDYCKNELSPHIQNIKKKQAECGHNNTETIYDYIPGEAIKQPVYELCLDCGRSG